MQGPGSSIYDEKAKRGRYAAAEPALDLVDLGGKLIFDSITLFLRMRSKLQV